MNSNTVFVCLMSTGSLLLVNMLKEFARILSSTLRSQQVIFSHLFKGGEMTPDFQATITIPSTLTMNVKRKDFFRLLEAQRVEHLLIDRIVSSATPNISDQYYSQALMTQRLQRAELEVKLYRLAILKDGLSLLDGMCSFLIFLVSLEDTYR
jgi:hypothetical protein